MLISPHHTWELNQAVEIYVVAILHDFVSVFIVSLGGLDMKAHHV